MGRTNPLALRVGKLISWPSNVSHPLLSEYIRHVFQGFLVSEPGIRSSLSETWVNVTVFGDADRMSQHPLFIDPCLRWNNNREKHDPEKALGKLEQRLLGLAESHPHIQKMFQNIPKKSLVHLSTKMHGISGTLGMFKDRPIQLKINFIQNPLLDAEILAQYVALHMSKRVPLAVIYKDLIKKMA
jgi:hypothetical protein